MTTERLEHRTDSGEEHITEWQKKAVEPFVEDLFDRNPELALQIARESQAVTGRNTLRLPNDWMDDHNDPPLHPFSAGYEEREPNSAENDILLSYREAAPHLDDAQKEHLFMTIVEAMAHRANAAFNERFPAIQDDFAAHNGHNNIQERDSYNTMMSYAREYFALVLQSTEQHLKETIKEDPNEPGSITWPVDTLRAIEQDLDRTSQGYLPNYLEHVGPDKELYDAYHARANNLAESFSLDFKKAHPDNRLDIQDPDYVSHFRETTKDYLPGDLHNVADLLSTNHAINIANNSPHASSDSLTKHFQSLRRSFYESLTTRDEPDN